MNGTEFLEHAHFVLSRPGVFHSSQHRIVQGVAHTGRKTTHGISRDPAGVGYSLPMPLLIEHQGLCPAGWVVALTKGPIIRFRARIANAVLPYAEGIWELLKTGEIDAVSIGTDPASRSYGSRFDIDKWALTEISLVASPANEDARIDLVVEIERPDCIWFDGQQRAAVFRSPS